MYEQQFLKLHGFIDQKQRTIVYNDFNMENPSCLFCTDVAAWGLDFPNVDYIIMYDISPTYKQYIHRAGWAARAEKLGVCINLLYPEEKDYI